MIKNIVFDYGNVLIRFKPEEEIIRFTNNIQDAMYLRNLIYLSEPWKAGDRGSLSRGEIITQLCNLHPDRAVLLRTMMEQCSQWLTMPKEIPPLLERLKEADYLLYYISNTNQADYSTLVGKYPVLWSIPGIASFREGLLKPDPEIFSLFLKRFSLQAQECLFIDDMQENTNAAEALGFQTITLTAGAEALPQALMAHAEIGKKIRQPL